MPEHDVDERREHTEQLAEERTRLARERTTLAHIRTGFASFIFGTVIIGQFATIETEVVGGLFLLVGAGFLVSGWRSYILSNRRTRHLLRRVEDTVLRE